MTASGLKKLFDQTWQLAYAAGEANEKERGARLTDEPKSASFEELFRKFTR